MSSLILNLPYSSCAIPPGVARALGLSEEELRLEHWRLCDPHLARLAKSAAQLRDQDRPVVTYDYSPIVADPLGLWALELGGGEGGAATLPSSTAGKTIAWKEKDREVIFNRAVVPYYQRLQECVEAALKHSPLVLVLTLRSYSSRPLEFEKNRRYPRPQATVSSEEGLTPQGWPIWP